MKVKALAYWAEFLNSNGLAMVGKHEGTLSLMLPRTDQHTRHYEIPPTNPTAIQPKEGA